MLYKFTPMGYFGRVSQISRGPWFAELQVEDDGLEYYYLHNDANGNMRYLLSNNMSYKDRTEFMALFQGQNRVAKLSWFVGGFVGLFAVNKVAYFRTMAWGWRCVSAVAVAGVAKAVVCQYAAYQYRPLIGAYFRKYQNVSAADAWELRDRKREYYEIDDSSYMAYTEDDCQDIHRHANHGPQPDDEVKDASYLTELDAFLDNKPNHLKDHKRFLKYNFEFVDKSYPSLEAAKNLIEGKHE